VYNPRGSDNELAATVRDVRDKLRALRESQAKKGLQQTALERRLSLECSGRATGAFVARGLRSAASSGVIQRLSNQSSALSPAGAMALSRARRAPTQIPAQVTNADEAPCSSSRVCVEVGPSSITCVEVPPPAGAAAQAGSPHDGEDEDDEEAAVAVSEDDDDEPSLNPDARPEEGAAVQRTSLRSYKWMAQNHKHARRRSSGGRQSRLSQGSHAGRLEI